MFRSIQNHPVALLAVAVAAVAFGVWLLHDATPVAAARTETADIHPVPQCPHPHPLPHGNPHAQLAHLPPGVPRVIVEHQLVLHPMPHGVSPVSVENGSATYTVTYPLHGRPLVLEFDAALPGHPFVGPRDLEPQS